ncbi:hypothetical protein G4B88_001709 [Cannabis sativa]|uniref:RNase H type-1 domain-containing protein n=1 Tax=Cannabis sativa TaxID=3483 RepID=A0A7J6I2Q5_CANSA|nr:hypothetical protein G4B88_001709 [Cannabis sativa]
MVSSVLEAELVAIYTALERAWEEKCVSILIEPDLKAIVEALKLGELPLAWGSYPIFKKCLAFSVNFSLVSFKFLPRVENSFVHFLAFQVRVNLLSRLSVVREVAPFVATN